MNAPYLGSGVPEDVADGPTLTLLDVWQFLKLRKAVILGTAGVILAITLVTLLLITPLYTASSAVMLDQRQTKVVNVEDVLSALPSDTAAVQNEVQVLQSRALAEMVVNKMHLIDDPEFNAARQPPGPFSFLSPVMQFIASTKDALTGTPPPTAAQIARKQFDATVDQYMKMTDAQPQTGSTTIVIDASSQSAEKAAKLADATADASINNQLIIKFEATKKATQWLASRLGDLSRQASRAEADVAQYKATNNLTDFSSEKGGSVLDQQLSDLTTQLILTRANSAEAEARLSKMQQLRAAGHGADVTQVVTSPLITNLREQEASLAQQSAQLSSTYGPRHPKILDILAQRKVLDAKIDEEVARVAQTLENDVDVARKREAELRSSMGQLQLSNTTQSAARVKLVELQANADSSRALYNSFLQRFKETTDQESLQTPDSRLVSSAEVPLKPAFPKKLLILALATPVSLIAGLMLALVLEQLSNGFRTVAQIERTLGHPALTMVPELGSGKRNKLEGPEISPAIHVLKKPLSAYSEAVRGLQMGLIPAHEKKPSVLLVTSSVPDEGKTTMAISLARQAAQNGQRVVLIDCDLRRSSVSDMLGLGARTHWLDDYLRGDCEVESVLVKDPLSSLRVIPSHSGTPNAPILLASARMKQLLDTLRRDTDLIVMDSAPMLPVHDTKNLVPLTDAVLFVVRWEKTPRGAAVAAYKSLQELGARIGKVVLMRTDAERFDYYNFGSNTYAYRPYYVE